MRRAVWAAGRNAGVMANRRAHQGDGDGGKGPGALHVNQLEKEEQAKETDEWPVRRKETKRAWRHDIRR